MTIFIVVAVVLVIAWAMIVWYGPPMVASNARVSQTIAVDVAPRIVFPIINDFQQMNSLLALLQPEQSVEWHPEHQTRGRGATGTWQSRNDDASGSLSITESTPLAYISLVARFVRPRRSVVTIVFKLSACSDQSTNVTCEISGKSRFFRQFLGDDFAGKLARANQRFLNLVKSHAEHSRTAALPPPVRASEARLG